MRFHHQFVKSKELDVRQIQTIHANTTAIYALVNTLKDHFSMSTLFMLFDESLVTRSTRRKHSSSQQDENDESSSEKENENRENDEKNEENENDEN